MFTPVSSPNTSAAEQGIASRFVVRLCLIPIYFWQRAISPFIGHHCRFDPTCSEYSKQAFLKYGALRGLGLSIARVCRCNPWCEPGEDPVP